MSAKSSRRCKMLKLTPPLLPANSVTTLHRRSPCPSSVRTEYCWRSGGTFPIGSFSACLYKRRTGQRKAVPPRQGRRQSRRLVRRNRPRIAADWCLQLRGATNRLRFGQSRALNLWINWTKGMSDHMIEPDFKSLRISMRRRNLENPRMNRRRLKRLCAALPLLLLAIPEGSRSQEISKEVPVNAQAKRYGTGWECKRGFRWDGAACIAIKLPENAYLSETSSGWECKRGYKGDGSSCVTVRVPQNAYLSGLYGDEWECERGYQKTRAGCFSVLVPKNGYLIDSFQGRGWNCDHGFRASGNECVAVKVPQNAYLSDSSLTTGWQCERGFQQSGDICLPIEVPRNGYLNGFGTGWKCERGFKKEGGDCVSVKLPTNAHLDYSGSDWSCDRPFRRQNDSCVLSQ